MYRQVWVFLVLLFACAGAYDEPKPCPEVKIMNLTNADRLAIMSGCQGPAGQKGAAGEPGMRGLKGDPGPPGKAGPQGNEGPAGPNGDKGDAGPKCDRGDAGPKGDRGEAGPKGDRGDAGPKGDRGDTGPKGDRGDAGSKGDRGDAGPRGDTPDVASIYCKKGPRSCTDILNRGNTISGWYSIYLVDCKLLQVFCDMETDGGGWLVFQKRLDGSVEFYRNYETYKNGFGRQMSEFWLGNDNIHLLTQAGNMSLRVDLEDFAGIITFAKYETFTLRSEIEQYRLNVGRFLGGSAGDSLSQHSGKLFSTFDQDNDEMDFNCAVAVRGAWWYYTCYSSNLNGAYAKNGKEVLSYGLDWRTGNGIGKSYKRTEMKLR